MDLFGLDPAPVDLVVVRRESLSTWSRGPLTGELSTDEHFAHLELASPCVHPWLVDVVRALLGHPRAVLDAVIWEEDSLVIEPGSSGLRRGDRVAGTDLAAPEKGLEIDTGARALGRLLERVDLDERLTELEGLSAGSAGSGERLAAIDAVLAQVREVKRLGFRPVDAVIDVVPIPPRALRPQPAAPRTPGALYGKLVLVNRRVAQLQRLDAPEVLQVDARRRLLVAISDVFTTAIGKLLRDGGLLSAAPTLGGARLDATIKRGGEESQVETCALRLDGARALLTDALANAPSPWPPALAQILLAMLVVPVLEVTGLGR